MPKDHLAEEFGKVRGMPIEQVRPLIHKEIIAVEKRLEAVRKDRAHILKEVAEITNIRGIMKQLAEIYEHMATTIKILAGLTGVEIVDYIAAPSTVEKPDVITILQDLIILLHRLKIAFGKILNHLYDQEGPLQKIESSLKYARRALEIIDRRKPWYQRKRVYEARLRPIPATYTQLRQSMDIFKFEVEVEESDLVLIERSLHLVHTTASHIERTKETLRQDSEYSSEAKFQRFVAELDSARELCERLIGMLNGIANDVNLRKIIGRNILRNYNPKVLAPLRKLLNEN